MDFSQAKLDEFLCNADEIVSIGMDDLHELTHALAAKGLIDKTALNAYLYKADSVASNKRPGQC